MEYPLCYMCRIKDILNTATCVDHIVLFKDRYDELSLNSDNLVSLCSECHGAITCKEKTIKYKLLELYHVKSYDLKQLKSIKYKMISRKILEL